MTREIKFRSAFFKHGGGFSHFNYWGFINHKDECDDRCFKSPSQNNNSYRKHEDQSTGLKDKNGREIYEGDIIESTGTGMFTGQVCYDPQFTGFLIKWSENNMKIHRYAQFNVTSGSEDGYCCDFMEVIGNIYENPELLKS